MTAPTSAATVEVKTLTETPRTYLRALVIGLIGIVAAAALIFVSPERGLSGYLTSWLYWLSVAIGGLGWLMAFHAARAKWMVVIRRFLETQAFALIALAVLFIPVVVGMKYLYLWVAPPAGLSHEQLHHIQHKAPYLNIPFFVGRVVFYFACWIGVALLLRRFSVRQDTGGDLQDTVRQRQLGAGAIPLIGLTVSFAAFDWIMSLRPDFASTIFGLYYIAGSMLAGVAVWIIAVTLADRAGFMTGLLTESHYHSMGKLLLAMTCFWAYIAFSQYMLVWIGNLPEETPWYLTRTDTGWRPVGIALAVLHFAVPFLILLSRDLKRRPGRLLAMAVWQLIMHYVDVWWLVGPRVSPERPALPVAELASLIGIGGLVVAFALRTMRGVAVAPAKDPYLGESARYHK